MQKTAYEMRISDWSSDVCSSDLMGTTAENVAKQFQITREAQDEFAVKSQNKAEAAQKAGKFKDEIVPVTIKGRKGDTVVDQDEYIRHGATLDSVKGLRPAFQKDGTVTAAKARSEESRGGQEGGSTCRSRGSP